MSPVDRQFLRPKSSVCDLSATLGLAIADQRPVSHDIIIAFLHVCRNVRSVKGDNHLIDW
jgi:hypothetical protein